MRADWRLVLLWNLPLPEAQGRVKLTQRFSSYGFKYVGGEITPQFTGSQ